MIKIIQSFEYIKKLNKMYNEVVNNEKKESISCYKIKEKNAKL